MGIGGCIILIAVGAIVTFATDWHAKGVNVDLIGLIMMAVGMIGLAAYVSIFKRRRIPRRRTAMCRPSSRSATTATTGTAAAATEPPPDRPSAADRSLVRRVEARQDQRES